jgi:hypothetical protein
VTWSSISAVSVSELVSVGNEPVSVECNVREELVSEDCQRGVSQCRAVSEGHYRVWTGVQLSVHDN